MPEKKEIPVDPKTKALIFDCDGTLVDTMPLHMKAWEEALKKSGLHFDYDFFYSRRGMSEKDIINEFGWLIGKEIDGAGIVESKHEYYSRHLNSVKPIGIVADIVYKYKDIMPMAIVSGGTRKNVAGSLEAVGLKKYFKIIITADDNLRPKPAPDKFLEAAKLLKVEPEYCQVFEDGHLGIQAAEEAGMITTDVIPFIL